jgi:deoxycytidylate deaminase
VIDKLNSENRRLYFYYLFGCPLNVPFVLLERKAPCQTETEDYDNIHSPLLCITYNIMKLLSNNEEKIAWQYILQTAEIAKQATCERSKCGSIIVQSNEIIGLGFNSPPGNLESQRRCSISKDSYNQKVTDKTCCVHAEQRAIMDALTRNPDRLIKSRLYFVRLDGDGEIVKAGKPYCTICSKMALDVGISEFVLWQEEGICVYDTEEYNNISYEN